MWETDYAAKISAVSQLYRCIIFFFLYSPFKSNQKAQFLRLLSIITVRTYYLPPENLHIVFPPAQRFNLFAISSTFMKPITFL